MLVLTRRVTESLMIGSDIRITIIRVGAGQVRIGIEAPREIPVHRAEVLTPVQPASTGAHAKSADSQTEITIQTDGLPETDTRPRELSR